MVLTKEGNNDFFKYHKAIKYGRFIGESSTFNCKVVFDIESKYWYGQDCGGFGSSNSGHYDTYSIRFIEHELNRSHMFNTDCLLPIVNCRGTVMQDNLSKYIDVYKYRIDDYNNTQMKEYNETTTDANNSTDSLRNSDNGDDQAG